MPYYAVANGRKTGVFSTWEDCKDQILGFKDALFKKFATQEAGLRYVKQFSKKQYFPSTLAGKKCAQSTVAGPSKDTKSNNLPELAHAAEDLRADCQMFAKACAKEMNIMDHMDIVLSDYKNTSKGMESTEEKECARCLLNSVERLERCMDAVRKRMGETKQLLENIETPDETDSGNGMGRLATNRYQSVKHEKLQEEDEIEIKSIVTVPQDTAGSSSMERLATGKYTSMRHEQLQKDDETLARRVIVVPRDSSGNSRLSEGDYIVHDVVEVEAIEEGDSDDDCIYISTCEIPSEKSATQTSAKRATKTNFDFVYDSDGYVIVYTDGACEKNGCHGAKAGVGVWFGDSHPLNISEPVKGRNTNNVAEIEAAVAAISAVKATGGTKVVIRTDSQFMIKCITMWIKKWKRNNWQASTGQPVKNKTDLVVLDRIMQSMDVKWEHVRGHAGIHGNEMADALARAGAQAQKL